jgi:glycosyltransferase involved in cell wall biosynthesis
MFHRMVPRSMIDMNSPAKRVIVHRPMIPSIESIVQKHRAEQLQDVQSISEKPPMIFTVKPMNDPNELLQRRIDHYFDNNSYDCYVAFYNPFPLQKNAEFELLQRCKITCEKINVGFLLIHNDNIIQDTELKGIHIDTIDVSNILCIISLHPESPKTTKHFTIITLWNPIEFHDENSWKRTLTMDGFLSAYSDNIDHYIKERSDKPFVGYLNTTLSGPILDITFGQCLQPNYKCFYIGMNWENRCNYLTYNRKTAIDLIHKLDHTDLISIYGPKYAWTGCKSYIGEIPFDGESIVYEIHRCGICLVLSSQHHMDDSVCSNRLFEGLAAGVPIISDKNPFIQTWFGDNIFYIDTSSADIAVHQIQEYIAYFTTNPEETLVKIQNCREIFMNHFLMDKQLLQIIQNIKEIRNPKINTWIL